MHKPHPACRRPARPGRHRAGSGRRAEPARRADPRAGMHGLFVADVRALSEVRLRFGDREPDPLAPCCTRAPAVAGSSRWPPASATRSPTRRSASTGSGAWCPTACARRSGSSPRPPGPVRARVTIDLGCDLAPLEAGQRVAGRAPACQAVSGPDRPRLGRRERQRRGQRRRGGADVGAERPCAGWSSCGPGSRPRCAGRFGCRDADPMLCRAGRAGGVEPPHRARRRSAAGPAGGPLVGRPARPAPGRGSVGSGRREHLPRRRGALVPHAVRPGQHLGRPDAPAARHGAGRGHPARRWPAGRGPLWTTRPARRPARSCTSCAATTTPGSGAPGRRLPPPAYYGSVDATLLWISLLADAWRVGDARRHGR